MNRQQGQGQEAKSPAALTGEGIIYDPFTISLHLTDLCNSACVFCGGDFHLHSKDSVKTGKLMNFLEKCKGDKWSTVNIHGGEPTVRKDFLFILEKIRELGYKKIILQTNALKMADKKFAAKVNSIWVDIFTVGFHGHTPGLVEQATGRAKNFELALKGFHHIKEAGSLLRITTVVCNLNYQNMKDICRVAIENGTDHINISAMQPGGSTKGCLDYLMISYREAYPYIKEAIQYTLAENKIVTLEGFPHCAVPGFETYQVNWKKQQLKVLYGDMVIDDFNNFVSATQRSKTEVCTGCTLQSFCGGVYSGYLSIYGPKEFKAYR
ncbi:MAG: radical SAM protein [Candidatus Aminicenantes bacterium]|jgi:MoaA/NifB/PqqE/SkfB family radical SAM enzyme